MTVFARLVGQNQAVQLLTQAVIKNRIAPAYLFVGPTGVGQTLAARCFVELLFGKGLSASVTRQNRLQLGNHPDLLWVQPTYLHQGIRLSAAEADTAGITRRTPPQIRLEQVREIAQFLSRVPLEASRSVVVIAPAETMAEPAANGLLKTLEEPGQATLILIAPSESALLPTLVSRCQRIPFYRLDAAAMAQVLQQTGHEEILRYPEILAIAQGSPGVAISSFSQLKEIPEDLLHEVSCPPKTPREALELARKIDQALDTEAQLWLVDYLQYSYWQKQRQQSFVEQLEKTRQYLLSYAQPRLVWEVTLLGMLPTTTF